MYKTMKIYYDNVTGEPIYSSSHGYDSTPSFDHDYKTIIDLSSRVKESIGLLVLKNGQYEYEFRVGKLKWVNVHTKTPMFEYPNPDNPDEPIIPEVPLNVEVDELKIAQAETNTSLLEFMEAVLLS